jgi:hypothetical protein
MAEPDLSRAALMRVEPYLYRVAAPFEKVLKMPLYMSPNRIDLDAMQFVRLRYQDGELCVYVMGLSKSSSVRAVLICALLLAGGAVPTEVSLSVGSGSMPADGDESVFVASMRWPLRAV